MSMNLKSSSWYRVAELKLSLRKHVKVQRHSFRGQLWYVIEDRVSGKHHRFSPGTYLIISLMDGQRTVEQIWDSAAGQLGEDGLTQDEVIQLLTKLHQGDLLQGDINPDMHEMSERAQRQARRKITQLIMNPLALRLPLFDPDRFLTVTMPLVRPLFSWFGAVLFMILVSTALVLAGVHWPELTDNVADRVLATESLLVLLVSYCLIKALHELGHGYTAKMYGGEVHEVGLMFLVFIPVPYVDASSVSSFENKWQRALVASAGMLVEMFLAAVAMFVWLNVESGLVNAMAFNIMLIGGVSTLLFNGNPLLRFDGYYVLSDLIEIPNLGVRSNRYIGYLIQRYLFGVKTAVSPAIAPGEARWFLFYSITSYLYRLVLTITIILFVASEYLFLGIILGIWSGMMVFVVPIGRSFKFLFTSPVLRRQRSRAIAITAGSLGTLFMFVTLIPVPYATVTEGVVWAEKESLVHAGADGVVEELLVAPNAQVVKGQPLLIMKDHMLFTQVRLAKAELEELRLRYAALKVLDQSEARVAAEQIRHAQAEYDLNLQRQKEMIVLSPATGTLIVPLTQDLIGAFLRKGDSIGHVTKLTDPTVRVLVPHNDMDLVRDATNKIQLRFADRFDSVYSAEVVRELPFVTNRLPSLALAKQGGGQIVVDPTDASGQTALENHFELDLKVEQKNVVASGIGVRVFVRFDHGYAPISFQFYRWARQLFLRRFNVG
jgi:putative peptide zinc metalloprotease protein